jgi:hypothetical protein
MHQVRDKARLSTIEEDAKAVKKEGREKLPYMSKVTEHESM